jgi:nucleoside-diphosphate-sugar epimerase
VGHGVTGPADIVLLGGSGYVGRAVLSELDRGGTHNAVALSSSAVDLTRPEALAGLDPLVGPKTTVVMAAALTPDKGQTTATFARSVAMVTNLADYLSAHAIARCVYISSDAVYGMDTNPVTESSPVAPTGYYALAKYVGEKVLECVAAARGIPLVCLRLTAIYGPGDPHGSYGPNAFARSVARTRSLRMFGNGEEERDHLFVDDAARAIVAILEAEVTGVLNVATGQSRSFAEVAEAVQRAVPYEVKVERAARKTPITHRRFDVAALRRVVPTLTFRTLDDGVHATLAGLGAT